MGVIAIVGATGTIGSTLAKRMSQADGRLILAGRNEDKLRTLSEQLNQPYLVVNPLSSDEMEAGLRNLADPHGGVSGIVNTIGSILLKPAHVTTDEEFRQVVETNLGTAFATVRAGAKLLRQTGGSIVLFASAAAEIGIANHEAIAAAKAGIIGLARSAAATYAPSNVRVNVVSPGLIKTELTRRIWEAPASAAASEQMHPLGRLGQPHQVASLVEWLLHPENNWITGQVIGVDGGLGHLLPRK